MRAQHCQRCLYTTDHPFGLTLDPEGICSGCRTHEEKFRFDWTGRATLLRERVAAALGRKAERDYDCVVPVRGTPEYFKVLDIVINDLGLRPLVVAYNSQFNSVAGIENIDLLRDTFDVDFLHYTTNPVIYRKLIRESLARLGSMRWPFLAGETQFPVQVAADKNIPLVVWPLHQPTEQAGAHSYAEEVEMTRRGRHEYDLMRCEPSEFVTVESLLRPGDIEDLEYPSDRDLARVPVRGLYLANYYPWDSRLYSEEMISRYGAKCARNRRTFDTYDRIDDCTYMTVHYVLKFARIGYSRVTDSLCREIRFGRISRQDALSVQAHFQAEYPLEEAGVFSRWLGLTPDGFSWLLGQMAHPSREQTARLPLASGQLEFVRSFQVNSAPVWETESYIIYGKGLHV